MISPTTLHVMGRERIPAQFRPGNQANMVAAEPTNPSASQDMLPGMGYVQSGNAVTDNGLAPLQSREIHKQIVKQDRVTKAKKADAQLQKLNAKIAEITVAVDSLRVKGDKANTSIIRDKRANLAALQKQVARLQHARDLLLGRTDATVPGEGHGNYRNKPIRARRHNMLQPWKRVARWRKGHRWLSRRGHQFAQVPKAVQMSRVWGPSTPDPLNEEPAGISTQSNRAKILAMQANIQPVESYAADKAGTVDGFMDTAKEWMHGEMIPGLPNWTVAGAGGAMVLLILLKRRKGVA